MTADDLMQGLVTAISVSAALSDDVIPDRPGYYSIWIDNPDHLPLLYADRLRANNTRLIYVGIATRSLHERLVKQDLRHKNPSTLFRSIGAVLGYRPPLGSLVGKSNQNNYKFTEADTNSIIEWINRRLSIRFVEYVLASRDVEGQVIHRLRPLLNTTHNPASLRELGQLRADCRGIARSTRPS